MNNSTLGKFLGWGQFLMQAFAQVFSAGVPHGIAWIPVLGSLATAIGLHAASATDGVK